MGESREQVTQILEAVGGEAEALLPLVFESCAAAWQRRGWLGRALCRANSCKITCRPNGFIVHYNNKVPLA
jgi:hypothetical protein